MGKNLTELAHFIIRTGITSKSLDEIALYFGADAASVVALKDFDITFAKVSSYFKTHSIDLLKMYREIKYKNVYFERALKVGSCIVDDYQNDVHGNPLWKEKGLQSVLMYRLDTEFNSVLALESFSKKGVFSKGHLKELEFLSPFISTVLEKSIYKEFLERDIANLDISLPEMFDKESLRGWLKTNLLKVMELTKAKAVSLVYPESNIYSFVSVADNFNFVKFKRDSAVNQLLTYEMFKRGLKAPAVFVYGLSKRTPDCLKHINDRLGIKNVLILPIFEGRKLVATVGYGYHTDMFFSLYDVNIVKLIAKRLIQTVRMVLTVSRLKKILTESEEEIINSFVLTIEMRDVYTKGHSQRVAFYARRIATALGLKKDFADKVYTAGLLHDIGKIGVPDSVLMKPSKLSAIEYSMIKYHPVLSFEIVKQLKSLSDLKSIAKMVRQHHERCNGEGYPDGLPCEKIVKGAKILSIADVFDALTTSRPYRKAFSTDRAIEIMLGDIDHFDRKLLFSSIKVLKESFKFAIRLGEESVIPKAFDEFRKRFSSIDPLTGLLLRGVFLKRVDELLSQGRNFYIFMIDVKMMDFINIRCGNDIGDLILMRSARFLKELSASGCKHFSRYGGDSFVFVVEADSYNKYRKYIDEFLLNLHEKVLSEVSCPETLSFTVARVSSREGASAQELVFILRTRKNLISKMGRSLET